MFYVDSERGLEDTYHTIVHEFNHMIWGNYEYDESNFLLEGLANYAIDYTGYFSWVTDAVTNSFTSHPEISLLYFNRFYGTLWDASYGQAYLFMNYLIDHYGVDVAKDLVSIAEDGARAVDLALANNGYTVTFNKVYLDWITACVLDEEVAYNGLYGFDSVDYRIQSYSAIGYYFPVERTDVKHYYYGFHPMRINAPYDNFTFVIQNPYPFALGVVAAIRDNNGWNITQIFNTKESDTISVYIEGDDITEAHVITSLMSSSTPNEYGILYSLDELTNKELDYTFYEGKYIETPTESSSNTLISIGSIILLSIILVVVKRKRRMY
jgi:hypothetical protein